TNLVDNGDGTITYTNEAGVAQTVDIAAIVVAFETTSTIVDNGDGTYTYTDEDGNTTTIDIPGNETVTNLVDNGDGTITYTNEAGVAQTVDIAAIVVAFETTSTIVDNGDGTYTYTDEDGNSTTFTGTDDQDLTGATLTGTMLTVDIENGASVTVDLAGLETTSTMVDNGDGTYTYTDEDGNSVTFTGTDDQTLSLTGTTLSIEDGNSVDLSVIGSDDQNLTGASVTGTTLQVDIEDGTPAMVDLAGAITDGETTTSMVQNDTNGVITYTDEDGGTSTADVTSTDAGNLLTTGTDGGSFFDQVAIAANETTSILTDNGDGTYTYTDEDGNSTTFTGTDDQDLTGATLTGTMLTVDIENGASVTVDLAGLETTSTMVDNGDGTYTYTDEDGNSVTFTGTDDQNLTLTGTTLSIEDGNSVDLAALSDSLVDNGDGTFTHTAVDGTAVTFDANTSTLTDNGDGTYTITNDDGSTITFTGTDDQTLSLTGTTLTIEDGNSVDLSAIGGTDDQNLTGASVTGTTLQVDIEDGTPAMVDLASAIVAGETTSRLVDNLDGTYTYTDEDGTATTFVGTDDQDLTGATLTGTMLTLDIENGASVTVDLAGLETTSTMVDNGDGTYTYTDEDGNSVTFTGTDDQTLSLTGTTLSIEDGNSVDLSVVQDGTGTDDQNLSLTGTILSIEDGNSVDLAGAIITGETTTSMVQNDTSGVVTYTDEDGATSTADVTSTDAGNILTTGTDGGSFIDQAVVQAIETDLVVTTDGTATGVTLSGTNDHTADITLLSTDANNALSTGADGGVYLDATATVVDKMVFSAEYAGAALDADGTDNLGFLTSDNAGSANNWMNYYHWSNTQTDGGTNDYDVILRFTLPNDFAAWETNAIQIDYAGTTDANFTANVYIETSAAAQATLGATTSTSTTDWQQVNISSAGLTIGAGDTGIIVLKMTATDVGTAGNSAIRLGDVTLNFTRTRY
ncbi:hypothetical protein POV27_04825, partial [Aureisphaera galaxeae]|uniref:beta strand repeat-containing protein n=1 Tax=Aureisphaera galaxeae TaxID=1538023 RepID=UPI0023501ACD